MIENTTHQNPKQQESAANPEGREKVLARILGAAFGEPTTEATEAPSADEVATGEVHEIIPAPFLQELRTMRLTLLVCCAIAVALWALLAYAAPNALAQSRGGGGDAISGTIGNVRDYIGGLMIALGGLGFVVSLGLKAASPINENAQYLAHMGIKSSLIAVLGGAIVGPVISIVQGLAAG